MRIGWPLAILTLLPYGYAGKPTPFQRATSPRAQGFSEKRIAEDTFYSTYRATRDTPARVVCGYLYRRAAEVTLRYGFRYFAVLRSPRMPTSLDIHDVYSERERHWKPVVEETPVAETLFMTIQCLKEPQEVPGASLIDAQDFLAKPRPPEPGEPMSLLRSEPGSRYQATLRISSPTAIHGHHL